MSRQETRPLSNGPAASPSSMSDEPEAPAGGRKAVSARVDFASDNRFASLLIVGLAALCAVLYFVAHTSNQRGPTVTTVIPASSTARPGAPVPQFTAPAPLSAAEVPAGAYDAIAVGAVSPKGLNARGVTPQRALDTATPLLLDFGPTRDTDESMFWLKRYIAGTLSEEKLMRAITKLGTLYAEPSRGAPDFGKARLLWEMSSAAGDTVAMCFLGLLHEHGLGVPASKATALQWFERAKLAGGCSGGEEAIQRLSR